MTAVDVRTDTIFTLLRRSDTRASRGAWWALGVLALLGWVGSVAFIGRYRPHQVVQALYAIAPRDVLFYGAMGLAATCAAIWASTGRRNLAGAALMMVAFLAGHIVFTWVYPFLPASFRIPFRSNTEALGFVTSRLGYAFSISIPMLLVWWAVFGRKGGWPGLAFRVGDFSVAVRDVSAKAAPQRAWEQLAKGYALFAIIFLVVMQANVGFKPILNGTLWPLLPAVVLAALANAIAEEVIFRGLIQPAFIRAGGIAAGLWMQGLMFGLMHWGMSVGVLAALPISLLIGLGSVAWGKAVLDTRGLAWVIIAHAMVDIGLMSAFFVPAA